MPSYLDLGLIVVILISAFLAMLRGFTREVLAIASWGAAALAAIYLHPLVLPYVKPYIAKDVIALAVSAAAVFFATLIVVSLITIKFSDAILEFEGRRARSVARLCVRSSARASPLRYRLCFFQLARSRKDAARMGQNGAHAAAFARDRRATHGGPAG